jgi:hypothetical protein
MAMGAILGITAWWRSKEKIATMPKINHNERESK